MLHLLLQRESRVRGLFHHPLRPLPFVMKSYLQPHFHLLQLLPLMWVPRCPRHPQLTIWNSPLTAHRSKLKPHRSPLTAHLSPLTARLSPRKDRQIHPCDDGVYARALMRLPRYEDTSRGKFNIFLNFCNHTLVVTITCHYTRLHMPLHIFVNFMILFYLFMIAWVS